MLFNASEKVNSPTIFLSVPTVSLSTDTPPCLYSTLRLAAGLPETVASEVNVCFCFQDGVTHGEVTSVDGTHHTITARHGGTTAR